MGVLTNTNDSASDSSSPGLIARFLINHHRKLCFTFYVCGVVWFLALAYSPINNGTYFSENALLPGLVRGDFDEHQAAAAFHKELELETKRVAGIPHSWLLAKFQQLGLDAYSHNFTLHYPMKEGQVYQGRNVYGILRAPRAASTEALVMSVPYRPPNSALPPTTNSVSLMLALAKAFKKHTYWAKDIIFLVTEHEQLGMQSWLEAYYQTSCGHGILDHGDLDGRSGSIQAAINLEIHSEETGHWDVLVEGLNGQLPNLDLVNLIHRLCHREGIMHTFKDREDHDDPQSLEGYLYSLNTLFNMVLTQATGIPNGNHGLFLRFGVQAVTLEGHAKNARRDTGYYAASYHRMGRAVEGIFRSLNNLLEQFHQSFFFYLLPATNRYISIGN